MKNILFITIITMGLLYSLEDVCCQSMPLLPNTSLLRQQADARVIGAWLGGNKTSNVLYQPHTPGNSKSSLYEPNKYKAPTLLFMPILNKISVDNSPSDSRAKNLAFPIAGVTSLNTYLNKFLENTRINRAFININPKEAPEDIRQQITLYLDLWGQAHVSTGEIDLGNSDAGGMQILDIDRSKFDSADIGTHWVSLRVKDKNGKEIAAMAQITVRDTIAPIMITNDITVALDEWGQATISPADIDYGSNDACGIESLELDIHTFDYTNIGVHRVKLSAVDKNGNRASDFALVTVIDTLAPTPLYQNTRDELVLHSHAQRSIQFDATKGSPQKMAFKPNGLDRNNAISLEPLVEVHPNPFLNSFKMRYLGVLENKYISYSLIDVSGRSILSKAFNPDFEREITINTDGYFITQGIYFLCITDGITSSICKLVKK